MSATDHGVACEEDQAGQEHRGDRHDEPKDERHGHGVPG